MQIPMGSILHGYDAASGKLWDETYMYEGSLKQATTPDPAAIIDTGKLWLNAPYLWGGKTFMGVDCSGFVQTVFRVFGISLLRDAWQQAMHGQEVEGVENAMQGDLGFFQNREGKVTHVGLLISGDEIIHASGRVRIDRLDTTGIYNSETQRYSHQLHSVRRYF
jgi:gamma-D-glutamyl-L-lysine dipeptidyl-peptidase